MEIKWFENKKYYALTSICLLIVLIFVAVGYHVEKKSKREQIAKEEQLMAERAEANMERRAKEEERRRRAAEERQRRAAAAEEKEMLLKQDCIIFEERLESIHVHEVLAERSIQAMFGQGDFPGIAKEFATKNRMEVLVKITLPSLDRIRNIFDTAPLKTRELRALSSKYSQQYEDVTEYVQYAVALAEGHQPRREPSKTEQKLKDQLHKLTLEFVMLCGDH